MTAPARSERDLAHEPRDMFERGALAIAFPVEPVAEQVAPDPKDKLFL